MTDSVNIPSEIPAQPAPEKPHAKGKLSATISFAVGIVLFFLPFVDIRCNNMSLKKINGAELATGYRINGLGSDDALFNGLEKKDGWNVTGALGVSDSKKGDPNLFALGALVLGALGLLISLLHLKAAGIGGVLTGSLAAASLVGLFIDVQRQAKAQISEQDIEANVSIAVDFTPWFYLSVIAFIAAAVFSYRRMQKGTTK